MADTKYTVELDLSRKGDFGIPGLVPAVEHVDRKIGGLKDRFASLRDGAQQFVSAAGGMFSSLERAADRVVGMGMTLGKVAIGGAAAAGVAGLTYGVMSLNRESESAKVALAGVFKVQGISPTVTAGLAEASRQVDKMRKDAAALPGEFQDLQNIFLTGAVPAFQLGMKPDEWREMSANIMAAGVANKMDLSMVARETALLLSGRSGSHNTFGTRLGYSGAQAEAFNKLKPEERLISLRTELSKYHDVIAAYSTTFDAMYTTAIDNGKSFLRIASEPVFEKAKGVLSDINAWYDANQDKVQGWASSIGTRLAEAFDWGRAKIAEWWPYISDFATNAYAKLTEIWTSIEPTVSKVGDAVKAMLSNPETIDRLVRLAEAWLAVKGAGVMGEIGGPFLGAALSLAGGGGVGAAAGLGGGGGLGGMMGGFPGAAGAGGAANAMGGMGMNAVSGVLGGDWGTITKMAALPVILAFLNLSMIIDKNKREINSSLAGIADFGSGLTGAFDQMSEATYGVTRALFAVPNAVAWFLSMIGGEAEAKAPGEDKGSWAYQELHKYRPKTELQPDADYLATQVAKKTTAKHPGGGGGTSIQKVEIVVTTNQNPSRFARGVFDELGKFSKIKRTSGYANNFAARNPIP